MFFEISPKSSLMSVFRASEFFLKLLHKFLQKFFQGFFPKIFHRFLQNPFRIFQEFIGNYSTDPFGNFYKDFFGYISKDCFRTLRILSWISAGISSDFFFSFLFKFYRNSHNKSFRDSLKNLFSVFFFSKTFMGIYIYSLNGYLRSSKYLWLEGINNWVL